MRAMSQASPWRAAVWLRPWCASARLSASGASRRRAGAARGGPPERRPATPRFRPGGAIARLGHGCRPGRVHRPLDRRGVPPDAAADAAALLPDRARDARLSRARGRGGWRRFSSLDPAQREAVLRGLAHEPPAAAPSGLQSLRAILTMGYLADPPRAARAAGSRRATSSPAVCEADLLYPADRPAPGGDPLLEREISRRRATAAAEPATGRSTRATRRRPRERAAASAASVRVFAEYDRDFAEQADVVVVGSGPAAPSWPTSSRARPATWCCSRRGRPSRPTTSSSTARSR